MTNQAAQLIVARERMVREQLQSRGIHDRRVLEALGQVPRERFVPDDSQSQAYADRALPIDCGQTISQPYIVALMTEALELSDSEGVLEIGTGSGYQTAVLAALCATVVSIERHATLSQQAGAALANLGIDHVTLVVGDGTQGWPSAAPYDRILVTAATQECPPALLDQLAEGGSLVLPLGAPDEQVLFRIRKVQGRTRQESLARCRFVPLVGGQT